MGNFNPDSAYPQDGDREAMSLRRIALFLYRAISGAAPLVAVSGFAIPAYDYAVFTYVGTTNNVLKAIYKTGGASGTVVATLDFTYIGAGASNDDKIATIIKS